MPSEEELSAARNVIAAAERETKYRELEDAFLRHPALEYLPHHFFREAGGILQWARTAADLKGRYEGDFDEMFGRWMETDQISSREKHAIRWVLLEIHQGAEPAELVDHIETIQKKLRELVQTGGSIPEDISPEIDYTGLS